MPRPKIPSITAWSFSRYSTYDQCPAKAKYQYIDKLPTTTSEAMLRGRDIHTLAERFVNGQARRLPKELGLFDDEFYQLAKAKKVDTGLTISTELQWAFNNAWVTCEWFGRNAWCRTVIDLFVLNEKSARATVIDHKTGKIRDGYDTQLDLYAAVTFAKYPMLEEVQTELWYLDQGEIKDELYTKNRADKLIKEWTKRVRPMLVDKRFAPKPSYLCAYCDFSAKNGGPCGY